jgi:lipopolysaccharide/colanic/teichoic acid biosynthesis glycosyltransferase
MKREPLLTRLFDPLTAGLALTVLGPFLALVALLIKLESPGPALFRQKRVGLDGRLFTVYKFRTMKQGSENQPGYPQHIADFSSYVFNPPKKDSRLTPIGRVLRATSVDELPQLLNVVKGDMRLVGPRPDEPGIVAQYLPEYHRRHTVKPGLTGLAQVNGRSNLTYQQMMAYDLDYADRHSFSRDLAILARTIAVVLTKEGAR